MKKLCYKKNAIRYTYNLMDFSEEKEYLKHIKTCEECRLALNEITKFQQISDYRQKIKDKLPSFSQIQLPEERKKLISWTEIISSFKNRKILRYATVLSCIILIVLCITLLLNRRDISKETRITSIEKSIDEKKEKPGKIISEAVVSSKKSKTPKEEVKWCFNTGGPLRSQPVLRNGLLYFGSDDKIVYSLNSETGKLIWEFRTGGRISSPPVIKGSYIYIASTDGNLYKLHSKTGKLVWNKKVGTLVESQIFINHSEIYIANNSGDIICLNLDSKEIWRKNLEVDIYNPINGDKNAIYLGTGNGIVYSLSRQNGNIIWKYETKSHFLSSKPLIVSNQLIFGAVDGTLYSFNKSRGQINWQYKTEYQIVTDPVYFTDKIYFASDKLYCLNLNGKEVWEYTTSAPIDINFNISYNIITLIDKNNSIYSIHSQNGLCLKKERPEDSILSFTYARNKIFAGNQKGEICVLK